MQTFERNFISVKAAKKYIKKQPFGACYLKGKQVITAGYGGKTTVQSYMHKGYTDSVTRVQEFKKPVIRR